MAMTINVSGMEKLKPWLFQAFDVTRNFFFLLCNVFWGVWSCDFTSAELRPRRNKLARLDWFVFRSRRLTP